MAIRCVYIDIEYLSTISCRQYKHRTVHILTHHTSTSQNAALHKTHFHFNYHKQHNKCSLFSNKGGCSNTLRLVLTATSREQSYTKDISILQALQPVVPPWSTNRGHTRNFILFAPSNAVQLYYYNQQNAPLSLKRVEGNIMIIYVMELGHLLIRSSLTYPEVSSKVCHNSFCQLQNSVSYLRGKAK